MQVEERIHKNKLLNHYLILYFKTNFLPIYIFQYPEFFTFGTFTKHGPTKRQVNIYKVLKYVDDNDSKYYAKL
jgi:hypothetical protein